MPNYPLTLNPSRIYQNYLQVFKKGAYNFIKEEIDPATQQPIPRKYFSGGMNLTVNLTDSAMFSPKQLKKLIQRPFFALQVMIEAVGVPRAIRLSDKLSAISLIDARLSYLEKGTWKNKPAAEARLIVDQYYSEIARYLRQINMPQGADLRNELNRYKQGIGGNLADFGQGRAWQDVLEKFKALRSLFFIQEETDSVMQSYEIFHADQDKMRSLNIYENELRVDLRAMMRQIIGTKGKVVYADYGMGMGVALNEAVTEFEPDLIGIGIDPVNWTPRNDRNPFSEMDLELLKDKYGQDWLRKMFSKERITFIQATARDAVLEQRPDIITSYAVLQYDDDPLKTFEHMFNQLAPGGTIAVNFLVTAQKDNIEAYLNMLDYLRRKADVSWAFKYDPRYNDIQFIVMAGNKKEDIVLEVEKKAVKERILLTQSDRPYIVKNVDYRYRPALPIQEEGDFYSEKNLLLAFLHSFKSMDLPQSAWLSAAKNPYRVMIRDLPQKITAQQFQENVLSAFNALFQREGLAPPQINMTWEENNGVVTFKVSFPDEAMSADEDKKSELGGIDFNADKMNLQTKGENGKGGAIKFKMDPAMLHELRNSPGFTPLITNIQPMKDIRLWLGLNEKIHTQS